MSTWSEWSVCAQEECRPASTGKNQKQQQNFQAERQQITDQLLQAVDLELPQSGVENETEALLRDFMQRNMQQGASEADFEKNKEELH